MLHKVHHYVTWGEVSRENVALLIKKRGRLTGNKEISNEYIQHLGYNSLEDLVSAVHNLEIEYSRLPDIKPVFRLHPPKKGFKGKVKKSYSSGGVTGYRGEAVNELINRMA
jgi:large subunit ribosomal protein L30